MWGRIEVRAARVLIVAAGPSLESVEQSAIANARSKGVYVIVVNGAILATPEPDAWFTIDFDARNMAHAKLAGKAVKIAAVPRDFGTPWACKPMHRCERMKGILYLRRIFIACGGLSNDPATISTGNSAWGALGLAWHMGARRIAFLGLDGSQSQGWPTGHSPGNLGHLPSLFESALPQLRDRRIEVWNGNPDSAVACFQRVPPETAIDWISG